MSTRLHIECSSPENVAMMSQKRSDEVRTHNSGLLRFGWLLIAALAGSTAHAHTCPAGLVPVAPDARYAIAEPVAGQRVVIPTARPDSSGNSARKVCPAPAAPLEPGRH